MIDVKKTGTFSLKNPYSSVIFFDYETKPRYIGEWYAYILELILDRKKTGKTHCGNWSQSTEKSFDFFWVPQGILNKGIEKSDDGI